MLERAHQIRGTAQTFVNDLGGVLKVSGDLVNIPARNTFASEHGRQREGPIQQRGGHQTCIAYRCIELVCDTCHHRPEGCHFSGLHEFILRGMQAQHGMVQLCIDFFEVLRALLNTRFQRIVALL